MICLSLKSIEIEMILNPIFRCNFPDIFFDSTSSSGLFGDDSHRFDRFVSETFKDHPLDFDLFPTASVAQTAEKLLVLDQSINLRFVYLRREKVMSNRIR